MPKKRANGEGNIRKRKDGRWEGRYTAGHDPTTGKPIYKNVLGKYMSVYSAAKAAYITVSSVEGVHTGVDYSIWGYTNNWKKEMGIE